MSDQHPVTISFNVNSTEPYILNPYVPDFDIQTLDEILAHMADVVRSRNAIAAAVAELERLGTAKASATYETRNGDTRYMRLVYPTQSDGSRKKEYIGADPERQKEALARIQRYKDREIERGKLHVAENKISAIKRAWHALAWECLTPAKRW